MNTITLTRQQLYDLVWSESLLTLSKKYIISDVGLRKICIRLAIPLPNAGHWNKVQSGKKVLVKPLTLRKDVEQDVSFSLRVEDQVTVKELSPQNLLQETIENDPLMDLTVKEALINPDPLVSSAQKELTKKNKYYTEGDLLISGWEELSVRVSRVQLNRALCFMDTFIKVMRQRGHGFKIKNSDSYVILGNEEMKMSLREVQKKFLSDVSYRGTEYRSTGILTFRFERYSATTEIKDGKVTIEQQLSKLIARLELLGERFRLEEIENEKRRLTAKENQRLREEFAQRKSLELSTFKQVLKDSARWKETTQLKEYIKHIEQKAILEGNLGEEMLVWLDWIKGKADWFDPLLESHDEWLKDVDQNSLLKDQQPNNTSNLFSSYSLYGNNEVGKQKNTWPILPWYVKKSE
jgi:hypothetical protein